MTLPSRPYGGRGGEARRDRAHLLLAAQRSAVVRRAQRALLDLLLRGDSATADDVRDVVDVPPGISPVCLGAAPGVLARARLIGRRGYAPSRRPEAHARPVAVWELRDRDGAVRWLLQHPNIDADSPDGEHVPDVNDNPALGAGASLFN